LCVAGTLRFKSHNVLPVHKSLPEDIVAEESLLSGLLKRLQAIHLFHPQKQRK
jgi:hypothetical protein